MKRRLIFFLVIFCLIQSIFSQSQLTLNQLQNIPSKQISFFNAKFSTNIENKIQHAPENVLNFLREMDGNPSYKNYTLTEDDKKVFLKYYDLLPIQFKKTFENKVYAIYFIDNFMGGGMSDYVFDKNGDLFTILYLNPKVLHENINDWITERDNSSFFDNNQGINFNVDISLEYMGILQTLVHEACHIYDYHNHVTPYVEPALQVRKIYNDDFTHKIWNDYKIPVSKYNFATRNDVSFYGFGNKLSMSNANSLITRLNQTPFASLYGATNWADDFAELFTWCYLKNKLNIEYNVTVEKNNKILAKYCPTNNPLVLERFKTFENIK